MFVYYIENLGYGFSFFFTKTSVHVISKNIVLYKECPCWTNAYNIKNHHWGNLYWLKARGLIHLIGFNTHAFDH